MRKGLTAQCIRELTWQGNNNGGVTCPPNPHQPLLPNTPKNPMDGSAIVVVKTLFGPAFVGVSVGEGLRGKWWFGVGRVF